VLAVLVFVPAAHAQNKTEGDSGCSPSQFTHQTLDEAKVFGHGLKSVPRNLFRPSNLKWELPIVAATGILIAEADVRAANRIQSADLQQVAGRWSNVGLGMEISSGALTYALGCRSHNSYIRDSTG
jgi:hypothetical protein